MLLFQQLVLIMTFASLKRWATPVLRWLDKRGMDCPVQQVCPWQPPISPMPSSLILTGGGQILTGGRLPMPHGAIWWLSGSLLFQDLLAETTQEAAGRPPIHTI